VGRDRFCEQWGVDDAALASGAHTLPVGAVDEFLAIETEAAKEGVEPTARYEALRPGMMGLIAAAQKIVAKWKRDGGFCQIWRHFQATIPNVESINGQNHNISYCRGIFGAKADRTNKRAIWD
jgi:hypothetical protein